MSQNAPIIVGPEVSAKLDQLHALYGRDQPLLDILGGLNTRLGYARQLYGRARSLPQVVNGLYAKLDKLRQLYGSESIELVIDDVISWRKRFNRLVELESNLTLSLAEYEEMRAIRQEFRHNLERQRARRSRRAVVGS